VVVWGVVAAAGAQEIDLTYTQPPVVMLALDTSGSMQWRGGGMIRDDVAGISCALSSTEKTREIIMKEVLTGTFQGYSLTTTTANSTDSGSKTECNVGVHSPSYTSQLSDGLLDTYRERLRFAFSAFDSVANPQNNGSGNDWSYPGTTSPAPWDGLWSRLCSGGSSATCSGCSCSGGSSYCSTITNSYTRTFCKGNAGIRSLSGSPCTGNGCLVSAGPVGSNIATQNDTIQTKVLGLTSSGGTPLAGLLKDIRWYFDNHPDVKIDASSNNFKKCRKNFVMLLTDGLPNTGCGYSDNSANRPEVCFRLGSCTTDANCPSTGSGSWKCVSGACQHSDYTEVDQGAAQRAKDLYNPPSSTQISVPVHVVGFEFSTALTCNGDSDCPYGQTCQTFADSSTGKRCSCTTSANCDVGESCEPDASGFRSCRLGGGIRSIAAAGGGQALFANDLGSLRSAVNQIFSQLSPESTSRTRVTSTSAVGPLTELPSLFPTPNKAALFLFQAAFTVPVSSAHWKGYLQRVAIGNVGSAESPVIGPINQIPGEHGTVRLDDLLNTQPRPVDDQGTAYDRKIYTYKGGTIVEFTIANITPSDLGVATTAERDTIVNFVRGEVGSARADNRLGAIYHASPTILEPPILDLPIPSYQKYRQDSKVKLRPPIVFVGSNLGMLHAFNGKTAKEEWAFIPPLLLTTLKQQLTGFTYGVDATPVARDVQFTTLDADNDPRANWHAVVVASLGEGGIGTFALDVTDPVYRVDNDPPFKFLWQWDQSNPDAENRLGTPFASPVVGTVFLSDQGAGFESQERAVVVIPGGKVPQGGNSDQGRDVWILDLPSGKLLKRFEGESDAGGMTGTCAAVDDFPGSFLTRIFCGDAAGHVMRINTADPLISNWTADPHWYDLYAGSGSATRQPIYGAPSLAYRQNGNLMMIVGSGDPFDLGDTSETRMGFVEETPTLDVGGGITGFSATQRKLLVLEAGEKLTGSPVVYNSVAYWATFIPDTSETCTFGRTRIWGVRFDDFPEGNFVSKLDSKCGPDGTIDTPDDAQGVTTSCLLPNGSVSFGFDLVRTPSVTLAPTGGTSGGAPTGSGGGVGSGATTGGGLKLVFQTGTAEISATSNLRDAELTPPGSQRIQVGSIGVPDSTARARIISWGKVSQ
jgi:hypothetical protein